MTTNLPTSRRFSAVLMSHPAILNSGRGLQTDWRLLMGDQVSQDWQVPNWTACHAQHVSTRNFYSAALSSADDLQAPGGYVHDVLVAAPDSGQNRHLLVAAPYVYFLGDLVRKVESRLGQPRPNYRTIDLGRAFTTLAAPSEERIRVKQFSVQRRGSSSADRLSVSGRNPLQSDFGRQFATDAGKAAYGIRIEAGFHSEFRTNVNFDRHGNVWWFHRGPGSLANVVATLDLLDKLDLVTSTRLIPPDHKDDDD